MSYEIIKSIVIKDGKVIIRGSSNNVSPRHYDPWECTPLTRILQEEGQDALDVAIIEDYESGNFHAYPGTSNKYTRAMIALRAMPEFRNFDWRVHDEQQYEENSKRRHTLEYKALLLRALKAKHETGQFIVADLRFPHNKQYLRKHRRPRGAAIWVGNSAMATAFRHQHEAEAFRDRYADAKDWTIIDLRKDSQAA